MCLNSEGGVVIAEVVDAAQSQLRPLAYSLVAEGALDVCIPSRHLLVRSTLCDIQLIDGVFKETLNQRRQYSITNATVTPGLRAIFARPQYRHPHYSQWVSTERPRSMNL